jgi:hypothetical protein
MPDWSQSGAWNFPGHDDGKDRHTALQQREHARREVRLFMRRLGILLIALGAMVIVGTIGFALIEHVSVAYGFEWTVDTITTLGSIPNPQDAGGRAFNVGLELLGICTLFYGVATVAEFFVSGQLSGVLEERRIEKMISSFKDHYIVCGFGRVGRQVARDLRSAGAKYVLIDPSPTNRQAALTTGAPLIESQASDDEILKQAGIERALGVIACVDSDAENIFIALTARELRSDIFIVARASAEDSEKKLLRAGAGRVIAPAKTRARSGRGGAAAPGRRGAPGGRLQAGGDRGLAGMRGRGQEDRGRERTGPDRGGPASRRRARDPAAAPHRSQHRRPDHRDGRAGRGRAARADVPATAGPLGDPSDHSTRMRIAP